MRNQNISFGSGLQHNFVIFYWFNVCLSVPLPGTTLKTPDEAAILKISGKKTLQKSLESSHFHKLLVNITLYVLWRKKCNDI